jgi:hypothetical protein
MRLTNVKGPAPQAQIASATEVAIRSTTPEISWIRQVDDSANRLRDAILAEGSKCIGREKASDIAKAWVRAFGLPARVWLDFLSQKVRDLDPEEQVAVAEILNNRFCPELKVRFQDGYMFVTYQLSHTEENLKIGYGRVERDDLGGNENDYTEQVRETKQKCFDGIVAAIRFRSLVQI